MTRTAFSPSASVNPGRCAALLVLLGSVATLGGAFLFQHIGGLAPCELCVYQRYPYGVAIALSLIALALARRPSGESLAGWLLLLCGLALLADAGIAVFHVGVEHHWWQGLAACSGPPAAAAAKSVDALRAQLLATPVVRCDKVAWSLFGISLAGYNVLIASVLALIAFAGGGGTMRRRGRR